MAVRAVNVSVVTESEDDPQPRISRPKPTQPNQFPTMTPPDASNVNDTGPTRTVPV